jgi:3-hydroxyacyl-CoA dehydrogenase
LREKVTRGELGAKTGQGFLTWPAGARERAARKLQTHVERRLKEPHEPASAAHAVAAGEERIARFTRIALWREALAMVEEGVCDAATVDLMATQTIGLRLAVMGPLENADYVGLDLTLAIHEVVLPSLNASVEVPLRLLGALQSGRSVLGEEHP